MDTIKGDVVGVIYDNPENGYKIFDVDVEGDVVTVSGTAPVLYAGEIVEATGTWVVHPNYGDQFKADEIIVSLPSSKTGMKEFLASGLVPGIGPVLASRIVNTFGKDTFQVIEFTPERLKEISGITAKKVKDIVCAYEEHKESRDTVTYLASFGVSVRLALEAYKRFGNDTEPLVRENPYLLSEEIDGFSFSCADHIAMSLGMESDCPPRIRACILHVLGEIYGEGHVFLPREELFSRLQDYCTAEKELFDRELDNLELDKKIVKANAPLFGENTELVYLMSMYRAERGIENKLLRIDERADRKTLLNEDKILNRFEKENGIKLDENQRSAAVLAASGGVTIVTGGPGTGKTTIIKAIIRLLGETRQKCLLAAPTGRAAKRMTNACGIEAKTIHRLLEVDAQSDIRENERNDFNVKFKRNRENPLQADCVIIDEVSMVDTLLMYHLLEAIPLGAHLVLVGDNDQLPSVGPGRVLRDLILSGRFRTVVLREIYRQNPDSLISYNAHRVNNNEFPELNTPEGDFFLMTVRSPAECISLVNSLLIRRLPAKYGINPMTDIQVITPNKRGNCGSEVLNQAIQANVNPPKQGVAEIKYGDRVFRVGDRVMQIRNNYEMEWSDYDDPSLSGEGVFNGEMGEIRTIDRKNSLVFVLFDDNRYVCYDKLHLGELEHCFAITVHKSQGSEFDYCIIPIVNVTQPIKTRNLLYTAITRAKKMVVILGTREDLGEMIRNNSEVRRYTSLFLEDREKP